MSLMVVIAIVSTLLVLRRRLPLQNSITIVVAATCTAIAGQATLLSLRHSLELGRVVGATILGLHWTTPFLWAAVVIISRELMRWVFGVWRGSVVYVVAVIGAAAGITAVSWRYLTISHETPVWLIFTLAVVTQLIYFPFTIDKKPKPHIATSPSSRY